MVDQPQMPMIELESISDSTPNDFNQLDRLLELGYSSLKNFEPGKEPPKCALLSAAQPVDSVKSLQVAATRGLTLGVEVELADAQGLLGRTIQTKKANISKDLSTDSDLMGIMELQSCKSAYCVPLQNQEDIFGVLLVAAHEEDYFAKPQQELLNLIGEQISISIKNFYDRQNLEFQIELLNELRRKTARELHDGLTQVVAALAMRANFARRMMEVNPEATEDELNKVEELARLTTKEIRQMIFSLQPSEIDTSGLKIAVESMAGKLGDLFDLEVSILFDKEVENLIPINGQRVIYSLIEESINIIRKNGGPKQVELRLREFENEILLLEIKGKGRKETAYELDQMNGEFESLQATAELIKATLQVDTNLESGSCLRFYIPQAEVPR